MYESHERDLRSNEQYLSSSENKAGKDLGLYGIWTRDLFDTWQRSAKWELVIMLIPNKHVKWRINDCEYMKVIYLNCGKRRKYERDLRSNEHYLSISEKKAWRKTFRPVRDLNPWPLRTGAALYQLT